MSPRPSGTVLSADPLARVAALPGVREAADNARSAVDTLLRHKILRRRSAEVTAEASLRAARACAALEGYDTGLDVLRSYLSSHPAENELPPDGPGTDDQAASSARPAAGPTALTGPADGSDAPAPITLGTVRLYAELGVLGPAWERAPRQALARMHVLLGHGIIPADRLGRPRADAGGGEPDDPLRLGPPPSSVETSVRLDGLTGLLVAPTTAPAVVVAAVVHAELLALRPFGAFDGIIARAAARLVLISRGLDPKALTATDVGHLEVSQGGPDTGAVGYREAATAYLNGGADGVATWIRHCAKALELAARESLAICEALERA